jgi:hypothetical protein
MLDRCLQVVNPFLLTYDSKKQIDKTRRPLGGGRASKVYHQTLTTRHCMNYIYGHSKMPYTQDLAALCAHIIVLIIPTHVKTANS